MPLRAVFFDVGDTLVQHWKQEENRVLMLEALRREFGERDRIDNAIRDLVGAGLLHRHGPFVFATHAAVRLNELKT